MELARQVQARLLPVEAPRLSALDCAGRCVQARAVGGDYFDYLEPDRGSIALVLADVSGKGFPAALLVASLHAGLRSQSLRRRGLVESLVTVNRLLYEATETNRYATLFLGRFDADERRLEYVNCGHNPPLVLRRDGSLATLEPTAMVVGLVPDWTAESGAVSLCPGDLIAIYSDGITEATDASGEEFGAARLAAALRRGDDRSPGALLDLVFEEVRRFSGGAQADDQTLVLARIR
jgi:serine phosphatase RsbU (regulator of sigma subunit)